MNQTQQIFIELNRTYANCTDMNRIQPNLLKLLEPSAGSGRGQPVEVVDVFGGLDVSKEVKVPHGELGGHLHGAQLQQGDLALSQELLGVLV